VPIFTKTGATSAQSVNDNGTILYEVACQPQGNCNIDQKAFMGVLARALAQTRDLTQPVEESKYPGASRDQLIRTILQDSAKGAAASCTGGDSKALCGEDWAKGQYDGSYGVGQQLNALEVFLANLPGKSLLTANTTQSLTSVGGSTRAGTSTTAAGAPGATGGASELSVGTSLPLIAMGVLSAYILMI
jgi:mannan endo-1,6-alpha-mannosidase